MNPTQPAVKRIAKGILGDWLWTAARGRKDRWLAKRDSRILLTGRCGDFTLSYPKRSLIGRTAIETGAWTDFRPLFRDYLGEPRGIVEVGANIGADTILLAKLAPSARILAFEPVNVYRRALERNIRDNKTPNVETYSCCLSSVDGHVSVLHVNSASASVVRDGNASFPTLFSQRCRTTTLDTFLRDHPLANLDLLKTDTDGFEIDVLRGSMDTIGRFKPFLFVEFCGYLLQRACGGSMRTLADVLAGLGYRRFLVFRSQGAPPVAAEGADALLSLLSHDDSSDVFAIPNERPGIRVA